MEAQASRLSRASHRLAATWTRVGVRWLPFADAATTELPLSRLVRLGLFQVSVGMATTLLVGTLNRVMIVELRVPASIVALMVAIPLVVAPLRAVIGHRSDTHRSVLGWKRVPFIWFGSMLQFGGLAIMPFALILLSGDTRSSAMFARLAAGLAYLLVGLGMHTTQTAGIALATDLAPERVRPRVIALLYLMLLAGLVVSSFTLGALLAPFSQLRLIQVIQGAAMVTMALNIVSLWKQEARRTWDAVRASPAEPSLRDALRQVLRLPRVARLLSAVAVGTTAFGMQDVLLEPYGGQVLHLGVAATTTLTALAAVGALMALAAASRVLERGADPIRVAALGALVGIGAFSCVIFASPLSSPLLFRFGTVAMGAGNGLFAVGTLTAVVGLADRGIAGLVIGAWGTVQATAIGLSLAAGGLLRDVVAALAERGWLGAAMSGTAVPYSVVYHLEIGLLFAALITLGPLVASRQASRDTTPRAPRFGLADLPG